MRKRILTATARWDDKRHYWKLNVQRDGIRRSFYSSEKGRRGMLQVQSEATRWLSLSVEGDPVLTDAIADFLEYKAKLVSLSTYKAISAIMGNISSMDVSKKRIGRVSDMDWQRVINHYADSGRSQRTCENVRSLILQFTRYAYASRWIERVPASLAVHSAVKAKTQVILQPNDIRTLFSSTKTTYNGKLVDEWYIHLFRFATCTGMRIGQIIGLQWDDITSTEITINRAINILGEITKGKNENARRKIPMTATIESVLKEQKKMLQAERIDCQWVFPSNTNGGHSAENVILYRWKTYLRTNGIDERVTLHNLRRTMISMHKTDMPIELLKQVVGHSASMDTFGVYGRQMDGETQQAGEIMQSSLQSILKAE